MMAITNFDVQPASVLPGLNAINQGLDARAKREAETNNKAVNLLKQQQLMKAVESGDPQQIFEFVSNNPGSQQVATEMAGFVNDTTRQSAVNTAIKVLTEDVNPVDAMMEHMGTVLREGGNIQESAAMTEAVIQNPSIGKEQALRTLALHAPDQYRAYREATGQVSDLPAGTEEFNNLIRLSRSDDPKTRKAAEIELGLQRRAGSETAPQIVDVGGVPHIFDRNKQKLVRADVEGKDVTTGSVAGSKAEIAATISAAESAIKMSQNAIEGLSPIRKSIANIDDAIRAIDEGAGTGAVQSFFPSVKSSSVELDNVRGQMGLDVIGGTTFGALSESELKFALDTALPTRLDGPELKAWLQRKKSAQQKMSKELESAAIYLGQPGNTPAGYLEFRRNTIDPQEAEAQSVTDLVNKYAQ